MKRTIFLAVMAMMAMACDKAPESACADDSERYFGLHFDFHASPNTMYETHPIGSTLKEEDIREICRTMNLDFLQVDCKGHPGWTSYPSKLGNAIPQIEGNPLKLWRKVTKEEGVRLFMHYSGVWDMKYATENPDDAVVRPDGKRSDRATRLNGRYVDELLIPQLEELAGEYGVDGMWIDGECWGSCADFDPKTVADFQKETGIDLKGKLPLQRGDAYYNEFRDYNRDLFRKYVNHYVDVLHSEYPDFQIASNWAFTDHMPEKVCANVDYISGDLNPDDSYWWARYSGRAIEKQGLPWDLMAWGFRNAGGHTYKTAEQMMQEAAAVISLGGGFQVYITQERDGSPRMDQIRELQPLADFVLSRKQWCFKGHLEHQVAVLLSTYDRYLESDELFSRNGCEKYKNMTNLLIDAGHSVSIVSEHDLIDGKIDSYPVVVIPELYENLSEDTFKMFREYVENGGSLMLCGRQTCEVFSQHGFPCKASGTPSASPKMFYPGTRAYGMVRGADELASSEGKVIATFQGDAPMMAVRDFGKGKVAVTSCDIASNYAEYGQNLLLKLADDALCNLYEPMVAIESSKGLAEIVDLRKDGKLLIQILNANGQHHSPKSFTESSLPPVCDVCLRIRLDKKPSALRLQPQNEKVKFSWKDGCAYVTIPRVDIHTVLEVVE